MPCTEQRLRMYACIVCLPLLAVHLQHVPLAQGIFQSPKRFCGVKNKAKKGRGKKRERIQRCVRGFAVKTLYAALRVNTNTLLAREKGSDVKKNYLHKLIARHSLQDVGCLRC